MAGKVFGLYSLISSIFCLMLSEFHFSWLPFETFELLVFLAIVPPWAYLSVFMTKININVAEESSREDKALYSKRMGELRRRFPGMLLLFLSVLIFEVLRCFYDSMQEFWLPHLFVALFLVPAIMLLRVFPSSGDLIEKWKEEDTG
jgi:hypothetical protein